MTVRQWTCCLSYLAVLGALAIRPTRAQSAQEALWAGQVQCQLNTKSDGYAHREIQTWTMTGPPRRQGAMAIYSGTWSAEGEGATLQTQGIQRIAARWSSHVAPMSAPIAILIRASDNRLIIKSWHLPMSVPAALSTVREVSAGNASPTQTNLASSAGEWPFPVVEDDAASTHIRGSGTVIVTGNLLPMQTASAKGTADCQWQFSKGAAATPGVALNSASQALLPLSTEPESNHERPLPIAVRTGSPSTTQNQTGMNQAGQDPGSAAAGPQSSTQNGTQLARPLTSYSGDNVSGIWSAKQCTSCHRQGSKLNLSGSSQNSYAGIMSAIAATPTAAESKLLTCPTGIGDCSGGSGGYTSHPGGQNFALYTAEYSLILRWLQDGRQP